MRPHRVLWLVLLLCLPWTGAPAQNPVPWTQTGPTQTGPAQTPQTAAAQTGPLRAGVHLSPPFVMRGPAFYHGYAVELFETIASRLGLRHEYTLFATLPDMLDAVARGDIDVAVSNLTITHDRLVRMDFTQPWFDDGLRIMVNERRHVSANDLISQLSDSGHLRIYLWLALAIVAGTIALTLLDRYFDPDFPREWHRGVAESFYHVMAVVTSGATSHKELFGAFGRLLSAVWMVVGVVVIAYITSSVTSVMTTNTLTTRIASIADLSDKTIGVLRGSAAATFAIDSAWQTQAFDTIDAAVAALVARQVDAVVGDASVLEYYDKSHPELPVTEVGGLFRPEKYGFALPLHSPLHRDFSRQIMMARENGYLDRLRARHFGTRP